MRTRLISFLIGVLVTVGASAQTPQPSNGPCGQVTIGGKTHYPGETWYDNQGVHAVPPCAPSLVTPTAPPAVPPTAAAKPAAPLSSAASASIFCTNFDQNFAMASEPCQYSGWNQTVSVTMNLAPETAQAICIALVATTTSLHFERGWRLLIFSPYSGQRSIAFCNLGG